LLKRIERRKRGPPLTLRPSRVGFQILPRTYFIRCQKRLRLPTSIFR
jgi:hypothetical protein